MKTNVFLHIASRIIILFGIGIIMSFVPENLRGFFGDSVHTCTTTYCHHGEFIDDGMDWGSRHYWYFWMCISLFILSLINFIVSIRTIILKEYPNLK